MFRFFHGSVALFLAIFLLATGDLYAGPWDTLRTTPVINAPNTSAFMVPCWTEDTHNPTTLWGTLLIGGTFGQKLAASSSSSRASDPSSSYLDIRLKHLEDLESLGFGFYIGKTNTVESVVTCPSSADLRYQIQYHPEGGEGTGVFPIYSRTVPLAQSDSGGCRYKVVLTPSDLSLSNLPEPNFRVVAEMCARTTPHLSGNKTTIRVSESDPIAHFFDVQQDPSLAALVTQESLLKEWLEFRPCKDSAGCDL